MPRMAGGPSFSLITKVLDRRHLVILQDWLDFLTRPPADLALYVGDDAELRRRIDELAAAAGVPWAAVPVLLGDDLANDETAILQRLARSTTGEFLLSVNLDTLPFRSGPDEAGWLDEIFQRLAAGNFAYFTGGGIRFRDDREEIPGRFLRTRQFSNNFGLISRAFWDTALERHPPASKGEAARRFHSEWAITEELLRQDRSGLRRYDTMSWRVFHVQQWDDRLLQTRARFRRGDGVGPFLNRVYEDYRHPWQWHFNYPVPPLLTRLRIRIGEWRRGER
jgi:hypothetical protein